MIDYRGAIGVPAPGFNAERLDPYGDIMPASTLVTFLNDVAVWTDDITDVNGARYLQARLSFINNLETRLNAELSTLAFSFTGF